MLGRYAISIVFCLGLLAPLCSAQRVAQGIDTSQVGSINVHVEYASSQPAGRHLRVRLMSGSGSTTISENFTNEQGTAQFVSIPIGEYHIIVSGEGIQEADSGEFEIDRRKLSQSVYVTVRPAENAEAAEEFGQATVSKAALAIPRHAQKEFDRGTDAMAHQDWPKALQHLQKAIEIYPGYPMAYNNLGAVYGHMNDLPHERQAFQKAIEADSHFAPGYVNLAKLALREQNAAKAETLLETADRAEPNSPEIMTLLAQAELLNKDFDAAVLTAHKVHELPHEKFAIVHYIAARALEREGHNPEAVAELKIFLTEEPAGPRADHVREEMAQLRPKAN